MIQWLLKNKKWLGYGASTIAALVSVYQLGNYIYESGEKAAETRLLAEYNKQIALQREKYEKQVKDALDLAAKEHASELERLRDELATEKEVVEVIKYVTDTIEVPVGCDKLANDVVGVLDKAVSIANGTGNEKAVAADTGGSTN